MYISIYHYVDVPPLGDCEWNEWEAWTPCSVTCDSGTRTRTRTFKPARGNGKPCGQNPGSTESEICQALDSCEGMCDIFWIICCAY